MKNENNLVVKSNSLNAVTLYKNPVELKIFSKLIIEIRRKPLESVYRVHTKDLMLDINFEENNYSKIKKIARRMFGTIERIEEDGIGLSVIFTDIDIKNKGYIDFKVNENIRPHLLELSNNFTSYHLKNIALLNSKYSIRIYELLKQYQNKELTGWWKVTLQGLKEILKIDEQKYKLYGDFKRKVILQAQKELKEHTDIKFTFEEERIGRAVGRIIFYIQPNTTEINTKKTSEIVAQVIPNEALNKLLKYDLKLDEIFINEILKKYDEKRIMENAEYTIKELGAGRITSSLGGYFRGALKGDYANQKTLFDVKQDRKNDIEKKRREEKQKEEYKTFQIEKLKKEYEESKKRSIIDYIKNNLDDSLVFYNEIKKLNTSAFMKFKDIKEAKELIDLVSHTGDLSISNFRVEVYEKKIKDKMNFVEYAKDKGISIIEEDGIYKMILK